MSSTGWLQASSSLASLGELPLLPGILMHSATLGSILDFCSSSLSIPHPPVLLTHSPKWGKGQVTQHPASPTHTHTHTHTHTPEGWRCVSVFPADLGICHWGQDRGPKFLFWFSGRAVKKPAFAEDRTWDRKWVSLHWHGPTCLSPGPLHLQVQLVPGAPGA